MNAHSSWKDSYIASRLASRSESHYVFLIEAPCLLALWWKQLALLLLICEIAWGSIFISEWRCVQAHIVVLKCVHRWRVEAGWIHLGKNYDKVLEYKNFQIRSICVCSFRVVSLFHCTVPLCPCSSYLFVCTTICRKRGMRLKKDSQSLSQ